MIVTLTLNPAIDKTARVDELIVGGLNRLCELTTSAAGKGINVSKTIHAMGGVSVATGFLAGSNGDYIEASLQALNIQSNMIRVEGNTRVNLKVLNKTNELTELNELGPEIKNIEVEQLILKLMELLSPSDILVLSGSVPQGVPKDIYRQLIQLAKKKQVYTILDADTELFELGLQAVPSVVKPNKYELCKLYGVEETISKDEVITLAQRLLKDGVELVVVSLGSDGAIFLKDKDVASVQGLDITAHSSVGAGDAMVAALAYAKETKMQFDEMIRFAIALSAGAVTTTGTQPPAREIVEELMKQVVIERKG